MAQSVLFGRYRLLEPAGTGGTAEVWRARDERTGDEVALKRLHPIVFGSAGGRRRLEREFRALRSLRHPNVVRVRDLHIADDEAALTLDYVPGRSLAERLAGGERIPPTEAVAFASDVAAALSAAHDAGIVHRDVKPGNVLLTGDGHARLTDFGIAHSDGDDTAVTATGTLVGTLRYIAPEQLRGEPATRASDLYSLAAVVYEMLAGKPAFGAATPVALVEEQREGPVPLGGDVAAFDKPVRRALSPDPRARQRSVAGFIRDLRAALRDTDRHAAAAADAPTQPVAGGAGFAALWAGAPLVENDTPATAPPPPPPYATTQPRPRVVAGIAGLLFGALLLAALTLTGGRPTQPAEGAAPATPVATSTARPTPTPAPKAEPKPKPKKEKGKGHGHGEGGD
jgi:serine/threonine-protein kinase